MTQAEFQAWAAELRAGIDPKIDQLVGLAARFNPLELLARSSIFQQFGREGQTASQQGTGQRSESQVEYCQSLILARPFPADAPDPDPDTIAAFLDVVKELFMQATMFHNANASAATTNRDEANLRARIMTEALHVRGHAHEVHIKQTFREIAGQHDIFLKSRLGFSSGDFMSAFEEAERGINDRINWQHDETRRLWDELMNRIEAWCGSRNLDLRSPEAILKSAALNEFYAETPAPFDAWRESFNRIGDASVFCLNPNSETTASIYELLSMPFGENADFLDKFPGWRGWPLNPSKINSKPIIRRGGHYYLFLLPLAFRNMLGLVEELILAVDPVFWQRHFLPSRDRYLERESVALFEKLLPGCKSYTNLFYDYVEDGIVKRPEADALLIYDDTVIIVEAKAGKISEQARRGALKSLRTDLTGILDKAYRQALRVLKLIRTSDEVRFFGENGDERFRLRTRDVRQVFLVAVSFDSLSSLATGLPLLRRLGLVEGREWPWSVSLDDLRIIAEVSEHSTVFLHYLTRRIGCNAYENLMSSDEIDLFGHYLKQGLYFEENQAVRQGEHVIIHNWSEAIDDYFYFRMGMAPEVAKPRIEMPPRFEELITLLENQRPRNFVSACLALQNFDDPTRIRMAETVQLIDDGLATNKARLGLFAPQERRLPVIIGGGRVNSPAENELLDRCRTLLEQQDCPEAVAVIWHPPLSNGQIRAFVVQPLPLGGKTPMLGRILYSRR